MNILFTGGSGFIGLEICKLLLKKKNYVTIIDKNKPNFNHKNLKFVKANIENQKILEKHTKNKDIVYHFAAIADIGEALKSPLATIEQNIIPTINLLNFCIKYKVKKFVFASTVYVYSNEGGYYKCSKKASESYIHEFSIRNKINFTILRYGTVYGPSSNLKNNINKVVNIGMKKNKIIYEGKSITKRKVIHIKDAAEVAVEILKNKYNNKAVLVTGKKNFLMKDILKVIKKELNIKNKIIFKNQIIEGHYISKIYNEKSIKEVTFYPKKITNLKTGIRQVINYIKNNMN